MKKYLAVVICTCEVAGIPSKSLDFRTLYFEAKSEGDVVKMIEEQEPTSYLNSDNQEVRWPLKGIMCVDEFDNFASGDEVTGFISEIEEISEIVSSD